MDSAEAKPMSEVLRNQETWLAQQEEAQAAIANVGHLTSRVQELKVQDRLPNFVPVWESQSLGNCRVGERLSYLHFSLRLHGGIKANLRPDHHREKAGELSGLRQGKDTVNDNAIRFRTLAMDNEWNHTALYDISLKGLANPIKALLVPMDLPPNLDSSLSQN
ncbi:hypothetical protein JOB18_020895 [Solea senegalensis]|uniref:Uncharacterized protein n=1 Tax=Solea senegalensis TaxID=28829 RepID=A0AAV6SLP1_SOLSE|nr:hypothetical protein JOB18_020895 [Solea senegalensis]